MTLSPFTRRVLGVIGLGVALPALLLAGLGVFLTLRISQAIEAQSHRYNYYMAQQVTEAFEKELLAELRRQIVGAENVARNHGDAAAIRVALGESEDFRSAYFVSLEELTGYDMLLVESTPLVYARGDSSGHEGRWFSGMLLRDDLGQVVGAGGWWVDPHGFLDRHLRPVFEDRLGQNTTMYGGIESTRNLSVEILGPRGNRASLGRALGYARTAHTLHLTGPFSDYTVTVAATPDAPVVWAGRFVTVEIVFIILVALVIVGATWFGLRYVVRQIELAQIKSSFVSNVSHELKTPIALIRLAVETLEMKRFATAEESDKFLHSISREAQRLNQLVDNILDFARLEAGKKVFKFQNVDVLQVVQDTLESFRPRLEDQGFTLEVELPQELPEVRGDATALAQCLLNLLDNAMKYSRARRELKVSAETRPAAQSGQKPMVAISVRDRGLGIGPRDQKRIFEKFVRLETGLVHDVKGAGLGLSLVDQIMKAHGGRVELSSTLGEGSTFTLVLPAAGAEMAERLEPQARTGS